MKDVVAKIKNLDMIINKKLDNDSIDEELNQKIIALFILVKFLKEIIETSVVTQKDFKFTEEANAIIEKAKSEIRRM